MYKAALSQAHALCTLATFSDGPSPPTNPFPDTSDDTVRARIYWYAHMHEGLSTGMQGGRLVLYVSSFLFLCSDNINCPSEATTTISRRSSTLSMRL